MALNIGVNVIETDGRASSSIQSAATSVAAFLGLTERGIPNRPVRITNNEQFQARFGNVLANGYLALAVRGFFLNGGREAYVCRVVGAGAAPASATFTGPVIAATTPATPPPVFSITSGYRGNPDPGSWGNNMRIDVRDDPRVTANIVSATVNSAKVSSLAGLQVGSVVRFGTIYREITRIDTNNEEIFWNTSLTSAPTADSQVTTAEFRLIVRFRPNVTSDFVLVEEWPNLSLEVKSPDYAVDRINNQFTGSCYIVVTDLRGTATTAGIYPTITSNRALIGGIDITPTQTDYMGDQALRTGLFAFDTSQVQLLAIPDVHKLSQSSRNAVVRAALDYCALPSRGDCMFVGAAPDRAVTAGKIQRESDYINSIKGYSAQFQAKKVFGALYAPWISVNDPAVSGPNPARFIPPDGHVMGVYARTEQERGIFKAPAGLDAQVRGALEVSANFTDAQHTDLVRNALVNGIQLTPGSGITIAASRTLSTDTRWWFVNVRLLFNFVKSSLRDGIRFVRQEPHTEQLRKIVKFNVVTPFLLGLWRQGAFGSDPPEMVFNVKCDAENNPPTEVGLGNFRLEVYFYPAKPAEKIVLVVGQQSSGAVASEA